MKNVVNVSGAVLIVLLTGVVAIAVVLFLIMGVEASLTNDCDRYEDVSRLVDESSDSEDLLAEKEALRLRCIELKLE